MGRPKKFPDQMGTATVSVRISRYLAEKAKFVAAAKDCYQADYLDGILVDPILSDYITYHQKISSEIYAKDKENPNWRKELESKIEKDPNWRTNLAVAGTDPTNSRDSQMDAFVRLQTMIRECYLLDLEDMIIDIQGLHHLRRESDQ